MNKIGIIGLGVMGKSLALNFLSKDIKVVGYNRSDDVTRQMVEKDYQGFKGVFSYRELINNLEHPRKILLMVSAGNAVDDVLNEIVPLLDEKDIIIDGGNSYFEDTNQRSEILIDHNIYYFGLGVSGGEKGALEGPCLMPGGPSEAYDQISYLLNKVAAQYDGEPCCKYIGPAASSHYVKMIHNGIEYADMQLIVESYLLLKKVGKFSNYQISEIFDNWNSGKQRSYLIEITSEILKVKDKESDIDLIDLIVDKASQKGTGRNTSIEAIKQDSNASVLNAAYIARVASNDPRRGIFSNIITEPKIKSVDSITFAQEVKKTYYLGKIIAYIQGFDMMHSASNTYGWNLNFEDIASIFRAGCIIQSELLNKIKEAYMSNHRLDSLALNTYFIEEIKSNLQSARVVSSIALLSGIPIPATLTTISFIEALRSNSVGANLIQAQRDYFGAHTFNRVDREGDIHYEWEEKL
ncbi:MAG: NADP-dependent phosphogluconate dehydrogenase [Anaerorhabdus sp.]